ncbi:unnamed protein product [Adineta ricciae]|uniref:Tetratricopeptide repeat protein n=1 Tax=Adineta ricciae TaxID=249248 RepID=A0A815LS35_ADIRI|nr:unnamed protein product [Adineta ricciae]CAF1672818.1 unnamed protein product [Adineta ricciae]
MVGAVFRITNVAQDFSKRWIISMSMCEQEDVELNKLFSWLKDKQNTDETHDDPYQEFAALLLTMDMANEAQKFCHHLLYKYSLFPPENNELAKCYYMLGHAQMILGFKESSSVRLELPSDVENRPKPNYFACFSWLKLKCFKDRRYTSSASLPLMSPDPLHFVESLRCFEKALTSIDKTAANYRFVLGKIYHARANAYRELNHFKKALASYKVALRYYRINTRMEHRWVAELYADLGRLYYEEKHLAKALDYYQRALDVAQKNLSDIHPEMGVYHMGLAIVYAAMGQNEQAMLHIDRVANVDAFSYPIGEPPLSPYYRALDAFYEHKESLNTFHANKNNGDARRITRPPIVKQSRSTRPNVIYYQCPWCHSAVWIYRAFFFCKGSPCFDCLGRMFTLRAPRMNDNITLYLDYMIRYDGPVQRNERLEFFADQLRQNYHEAPICDHSNTSN